MGAIIRYQYRGADGVRWYYILRHALDVVDPHDPDPVPTGDENPPWDLSPSRIESGGANWYAGIDGKALVPDPDRLIQNHP